MTSKYSKSDSKAYGSICSRGTLMSYTDRSAQRRFKSNTPIKKGGGVTKIRRVCLRDERVFLREDVHV